MEAKYFSETSVEFQWTLYEERVGTAVMPLIRVLEVLGSNLGRGSGCPEEGFRGFPQPIQTNIT